MVLRSSNDGTVARRSPPSQLLAAILLSTAVVVHVVAPPGWVADWSYAVATGAAALLAALRLRASADRRGWTLIAIGLGLSAVGDLAYTAITTVSGIAPDASIADLGWVSCYLLLGAGIYQLLVPAGAPRQLASDLAIDVGVVAALAVGAVWEAYVAATVSDGSLGVLARLVATAYPVADAVLLALVLRVVVGRRRHTLAGLWLIAGVGAWLAADFASLAGYEGYGLLDAGWMLGAAALAVAVGIDRTAPTSSTPSAEPDAEAAPVGPARLALVIVSLLIPGLFLAVADLSGHATSPVPSALVTVVLAALAMARGVHLLRSAGEARRRTGSSERYFQALAANSSDAFLVLDASGAVVRESENLAALVGSTGLSVLGSSVDEVVPEDRDLSMAQFAAALASPGVPVDGEVPVHHPDGTERLLAARIVNLLDHPDVGGIVVHLHDVTDQRKAEDDLAHQAFHDALTGLANRALFADRIGHALHASYRTGRDPGVIYIDLDGFKSINDSLGHEGGDQLLQEVAARLVSAVRVEDTVARLGGDEFAILIDRIDPAVDEAATTADRILQVLGAPMTVADHTVVVSASIGIAVGERGQEPSALLRDADTAMYRAKNAGKNRWTRFDPEMRTNALHRIQIEAGLHDALAHDQFEILYQPVLELASGRTVGFEALLRWHHPEMGTVMPTQFIPLAEDTGLIVPIGAWVLRTACAQVAAWRREACGGTPPTLAVNLSVRQLATDGVVRDVREALERSGLPPSALVLEVTETTLMSDPAAVAGRLQQLRDLGVSLAVDDFGTGYSSLSYLRQFPIDVLKIDRSFVSTIDDSLRTPAIIRGLLDLGRTLGLQIIAEGIEHEAQRQWLEDEHCALGQGFLFAHPLSATEAGELLQGLAAGAPTPTGSGPR